MENLSTFDFDKKPLKIDKPIRLIELFAGIGSQAKALKMLGADFEHYRICEFDKYAIRSYNAIHRTNFLISDIKEITAADLGIVDTDKFCYIMTYSFPCQDLSLAGKGNGMAKGSGTRSGLLWEVERLLNECEELPQILLMENVTQVHGKKNKEHFDEWCEFLESKGYNNSWKDLNAKNFGIPQNRNRTFMVSVLGDYTYEFPKEFPLELRLKDMLETEVDEKFYLSERMINFFKENTKKQQEKGNGFKFSPTNGNCIGKAVTTRAGGRMDDNFIEEQPIRLGGIFDTKISKHQAGSIWDRESLSPTIDTMQGGYRQPLVIDPFIVRSQGRNPENPSDRRAGIHTEQRLEPNFSGCSNTLTTVQKDNYVAEPVIIQKYGDRGTNQYSVRDYAHTIPANPMSDRVQMVVEPQSCLIQPKDRNYKLKNLQRETHVEIKDDGISHALRTNAQTMVSEPLAYDEQNGYIRQDGTVGTLTTDGSSPKHNNRVVENYRIRKLTPKECWRLMGFDDEDFEKAAKYNSNTQLYKQAGNSIVVDVLYYIFREMF